MSIKQELNVYEIGGIGEIRNKTARFHSYECVPSQSDKNDILLIAQVSEDNPPMFKIGYPNGQKLLTDLCNLHLAVANKGMAESAEVICAWCAEHIHPYYFEEDELMRYESSGFFQARQMEFDINVLNYFSFSCDKMLKDMKRLYVSTITAFSYKHLMEGNTGKAKEQYAPLIQTGATDICTEWQNISESARGEAVDKFLHSLPALKMGAQYSIEMKKVLFLPYVKSVFDSAYYALTRFISVDAGATSDTGGKTSVGVCKACGRIFVKNGNRQSYCDNVQCQSIRNSRKANNYYHRKKQQEFDDFIEDVLS